MLRTLIGWLLNSRELAGGHLTGWRLIWGGSWGAVGTAAAVAAAVAVSVMLYRRQHAIAGRWRQAVLAALRLLALTALILLLAQPALRITKTGVVRGVVAILVDRTRSMSIVDRPSPEEAATLLRALRVVPAGPGGGPARAVGRAAWAPGESATRPAAVPVGDDERRLLEEASRFSLVKRAVAAQAADFLDVLNDRFRVEVMSFGAGLESVAPAPGGQSGEAEGRPRDRAAAAAALRQTFDGLPEPDGEATRIGAALRGLLEHLRGQAPAGVILLTDGANNEGEDPRVVAVYAGRQGVPIYTVGVGAKRARDLHLAHVLGEDVVFKDDVKPLAVRIESTGCVGRKVNLVLAEEEDGRERVLETKRDVVIGADGVQTEEIDFVPRREGRMRLTVRIEPLPDEQNQANNARAKVVQVIDKKMRVLYVEGRPRWDFRFLCHAMQRDRRVQPTVLLQEADPETALGSAGFTGSSSSGGPADAGDTPPLFIRTFPERREDLFTYDVVLFGDVNLAYLTQANLRALAEFVESGGGFALIAGDVQGLSGLAETPLGPVLPVAVARRGGAESFPGRTTARRDFEREIYQPLTEGYRPRLTPGGRVHPATRLGATVEESERVWAERPPFYWYCSEVTRLQPGAQVLLEHPTVRNRFGALPLVVVQPYGNGQAMYVGFDEVWRWRAEQGDRFFYRFYGQMIQFLGLRHLTGESRRVQVTVDRREVGEGEPVTIFARVLDASFKPAVAESVTAVVRRAPGPPFSAPAAREVARVTLLAEEAAPGTYRGEFVPAEEGEYRVGVDTGTVGGDEGGAVFTVTEPRLEFEQASRNEDLLRALADLSGGTAVELDGLARLPHEIERRQRAEPVHLEVPLWDSWLALFLVVALLSCEWFIRKRARLA